MNQNANRRETPHQMSPEAGQRTRSSEDDIRDGECFRLYLEHSLIGLVVIAPDGRLIHTNSPLCEMLGYECSELQQMRWPEVAHPDDRSTEEEIFRNALAGEVDSYTLEKRLICRNGRTVDAMVAMECHRRPDGAADHFAGVVLDITERKRLEKLTESYAANVVDTVPAHVVSLDTKGRVLRRNRYARQHHGYTDEEIRGLNVFDTFVPPEDREFAKAAFKRVIDGETIQGIEFPIITEDGHKQLVQWHASPLRDEQGTIVGVVGVGIDVTEAHRKDEQLRRSLRMEAIGRLVGGVAHDFNNHLTTIKGYTHLLLREIPPDTPLHLAVEEIARTTDSATNITRQLQAFGRSGVARPRLLSLNGTITQMNVPLRELLGEDVQMELELGKDAGNIYADPAQVQQVILSLSVHSRSSMPGGGRLSITTHNVYLDQDFAALHPEIAPGEYVALTLADTGQTMTPEALENIFEPSAREAAERPELRIGLAVVREIVLQSGGCITVESTPGAGTTYNVCFPRAYAEEKAEEAPARSCEGRRERILVVEDDEDVRRYIVRALSESGFEPVEAANPSQALDKVSADQPVPDLVLADIVMPEMSGPKLVETLHRMGIDAPVLYISGYSQADIEARGTVEELELITKPFAPDELCVKVREMLDRVTAGG